MTTGLLICDVTSEQALRMFVRSGAAFLGPDHAIVDSAMLRAAGGVWRDHDLPRLALETRRRLQSTGRF